MRIDQFDFYCVRRKNLSNDDIKRTNSYGINRLLEIGEIKNLLSLHISYVEKEVIYDEDDFTLEIDTDIEVNAYRCSFMLCLNSDNRKHWISEDRKEFSDIKDLVTKVVQTHYFNNPNDSVGYERFMTSLINYESTNAPKKSSKLPGISVINS